MQETRRKLFRIFGLTAIAAAAGGLQCGAPLAASAPMDIFTALATRRSIREFKSDPVPKADLEKILQMAMLAPSAINERPWEFVVVDDRNILSRIGGDIKNAAFAGSAPAAILLCLDTDRDKRTHMGVVDMGMCAQNILLAAHGLGLGAVFTGIYPAKDRMEYFSKLFDLPQSVQPFGLIIMGYPQKPRNNVPTDRFRESAIHSNKW